MEEKPKAKRGRPYSRETMCDGVVRHNIAMHGDVRECLAETAKAYGIAQGQLLEILVSMIYEHTSEIAKKLPAVRAIMKPTGVREMQQAAKKVDPKKLRAFLEREGAL